MSLNIRDDDDNNDDDDGDEKKDTEKAKKEQKICGKWKYKNCLSFFFLNLHKFN